MNLPDDPGVEPMPMPMRDAGPKWQRHVALGGILMTLFAAVTGAAFAVGGFYSHVGDMSSKIEKVSDKVDDVDRTTRAIDLKLAEIRGALGIPTRHAEFVP